MVCDKCCACQQELVTPVRTAVSSPQHTDCLLPPLLLTLPNSQMSLDQNLFTLNLTPHKDYPNVIDLIDPAGIIHYRKQRIAGSEYKIEVYGGRNS